METEPILDETEPAEPLVAARHALEDAFRKFRRRASGQNQGALEVAIIVYKDAQYAAEQQRVAREYRKTIV